MNHEEFMREAISLSAENIEKGFGGPFGAVIVKDGKIISRGSNQVTSTNDPTAHAEIVAIRNAAKVVENFSLEGCTIYTSCEPCPMCLAAVYWARIDKLYYANDRKDAAAVEFDDDLIYSEVSKEIADRKIPFKQILRNEALEVFRIWKDKEDKIKY